MSHPNIARRVAAVVAALVLSISLTGCGLVSAADLAEILGASEEEAKDLRDSLDELEDAIKAGPNDPGLPPLIPISYEEVDKGDESVKTNITVYDGNYEEMITDFYTERLGEPTGPPKSADGSWEKTWGDGETVLVEARFNSQEGKTRVTRAWSDPGSVVGGG